MESEVKPLMYFTIPDRRALPRDTPDRRVDHATRQKIDQLVTELRSTQLGLMFYAQLRPEDNRVHDLMARCDAEIMYYTQHACTLQAITESEDTRS